MMVVAASIPTAIHILLAPAVAPLGPNHKVEPPHRNAASSDFRSAESTIGSCVQKRAGDYSAGP